MSEPCVCVRWFAQTEQIKMEMYVLKMCALCYSFGVFGMRFARCVFLFSPYARYTLFLSHSWPAFQYGVRSSRIYFVCVYFFLFLYKRAVCKCV